MLLIYTNCCSYNPPEHNVRRDCEQVFVFFNLEYEKVTTKLQQVSFMTEIEPGLSWCHQILDVMDI